MTIPCLPSGNGEVEHLGGEVKHRGFCLVTASPPWYCCGMSGADIAKAFRSASKKAGDRAISGGRTVVVKEGRRIVSLDRSGKRKTVRKLKKAYVRTRTKSYKVK